MNITLSVDDTLVTEARRVATTMGKSLNQIIREYLEHLTRQQKNEADFDEFAALCGQGSSHGWKFNRDELHERA
jgi:predicted transcriptional regulator